MDGQPDGQAGGVDGLLRDPRARADLLLRDVVDAVEHLPHGERTAGTRAPMALAHAVAELAAVSLVEVSLLDVVRRIASLGQATVPGADEVSVTLLDGPRSTTVAFTGDLAVQLDERQYEDGFGPCLDAARDGGVIAMFDLGHEERYPSFVSAARRAGVTGTLSVGMTAPNRVVGGLNLYARGDDPAGPALDEDSVPVAEAFAGYAAVALANAGLLHSTQRFAEQLQEAMRSRAVIEQAKGVIVALTGCTSEEAFAELARRSRAAGRKLALVAADTVAAAQDEGAAAEVLDLRARHAE